MKVKNKQGIAYKQEFSQSSLQRGSTFYRYISEFDYMQKILNAKEFVSSSSKVSLERNRSKKLCFVCASERIVWTLHFTITVDRFT